MKLIKTKPGNRPMDVAVTRREKKKVLPWWRPEGVCITAIGDLGWTMMVNKQKLYVTREMTRQGTEHNDNRQPLYHLLSLRRMCGHLGHLRIKMLTFLDLACFCLKSIETVVNT